MKSRLTQYLATHFPGIQTVVSSGKGLLRMICTEGEIKQKSDKTPLHRITEFCHGNLSLQDTYIHTYTYMATQTLSPKQL